MHFSTSLDDQISHMRLGDHICHIYKTAEEQRRVTLPYLREGLGRNEKCVYIADDRSFSEVRSWLGCGGIDYEKEEKSGRLQLSSKREAYLHTGHFVPHGMIDFLRTAMEGALDQGFSGFRVMGEMTWALGSECGCDRLLEYEGLLNEFFPGSKSSAVCQYDLERFSPEIIRDVLRTHPIAIIDGQVCENLYYESPRMFHGQDTASERVDWMMNNLKHFRLTQQHLEDAIQSRDAFLSIASHELKTPLTSLKLQAQGLERILQKQELTSEAFMDRMKRAMSITERQVDRLSKLVEDLLDVSQINEGRLHIRPVDVELSELVKNVTERFSDEALSRHASIDFEGPTIQGRLDKYRMEQVLSNLLSNALKYGQGSPIKVTLSSVKGKAVIEVEDKGPGISEEDQLKIFERFERAICANEVSGLGLGLYISKEIVEAHHGSLSVNSQPGEGTVFKVTLPL